MNPLSWIKPLSVNLFRYFTKGAKIGAALVFNGRSRMPLGNVGLIPDATPIEYQPGKFAYDANHILRHWRVNTKFKLRLKNNSTQPAYNIVILNGQEIFDSIGNIPQLLSLLPNEQVEFDVEFNQELDAVSGVEADKLPDVPSNKEYKILKIRYQNEAGTRMYTNFRVSFNNPQVEFTW